MCRSMADIQSAAAEIRRGKKKKKNNNNKPQHENIYGQSELKQKTDKMLNLNGHTKTKPKTNNHL